MKNEHIITSNNTKESYGLLKPAQRVYLTFLSNIKIAFIKNYLGNHRYKNKFLSQLLFILDLQITKMI